jgi:hypothetical protein
MEYGEMDEIEMKIRLPIALGKSSHLSLCVHDDKSCLLS